MCSFWLPVCGSIVAYPPIYRLVPSPFRFEIRQSPPPIASSCTHEWVQIDIYFCCFVVLTVASGLWQIYTWISDKLHHVLRLVCWECGVWNLVGQIWSSKDSLPIFQSRVLGGICKFFCPVVLALCRPQIHHRLWFRSVALSGPGRTSHETN